MPYVINWNSSEPIGSTLPAGQLDDEIRKTKVGTEERMAHIIGNNNWATNVFPVIDGVNVKSLAALTAAIGAGIGVNPTQYYLPRKLGTSFADSGISDDGGVVDFLNRNFRMKGVLYSWPATATNGFFLQYSGGSLVWASAASSGTISGGGTVGKVPLWAGSSSTLADSVISQAGNGVITVANALTAQGNVSGVNFIATGSIQGASVTVTGAVNSQSISVSTSVNAPNVIVNGFISLGATSGAKNALTVQSPSFPANPVAIDMPAAACEYRNAGVKVVGNRISGWGIPTGTATRTTFASDTVTLVELGRRVKALIDDLTTHGLIGA